MSKWKKYRLGDAVEINKKSIDKTYPFEEITYLDTGSITEGKIESLKYYKLNEAPSRAKRLVSNNDIIYSTVRPIQRHYGFIENNKTDLIVSTGFAVISAIEEKANPKFLYYLLSSDEVVNYLDSVAEGSTSTYPSLRPEDLTLLEIVLPTLSEQTQIANILSNLDDKIDLLHRQNKTLEQLAETLFRQWFVEEAEESWEIGKLGDIAALLNGKSRPKEVENGTIPIYGGNGVMGYTDKSNYSGISIIIGRVGAYCGSLYLENKEIWVSDNALLSRPKSEESFYFLFYLFKSLNLNSMAEGSSHPLLTQTLLNSIKIVKPPDYKIFFFDFQVKEFWNKIHKNTNQIHTLTQLRDTLLPKLISGEVRVNN